MSDQSVQPLPEQDETEVAVLHLEVVADRAGEIGPFIDAVYRLVKDNPALTGRLSAPGYTLTHYGFERAIWWPHE